MIHWLGDRYVRRHRDHVPTSISRRGDIRQQGWRAKRIQRVNGIRLLGAHVIFHDIIEQGTILPYKQGQRRQILKALG